MKMMLTATGKELDKAEEYMFTKLTDPNLFGGVWFETREEAEEWGGDVIFEAICYYLEGLGIILENEEEDQSSSFYLAACLRAPDAQTRRSSIIPPVALFVNRKTAQIFSGLSPKICVFFT